MMMRRKINNKNQFDLTEKKFFFSTMLPMLVEDGGRWSGRQACLPPSMHPLDLGTCTYFLGDYSNPMVVADGDDDG